MHCEFQRCSLQHAGTVCGYRRCCHDNWCVFLCVSAPTVALTSWNVNSVWLTGRSGNAKKHDDLRALFVRVGISQSHFFHALNNCLYKIKLRHPRTLRSPALSSIRSNHLPVFHQTLHSKLSQCGILIASTSMFYYAKLISEYYHAISSQSVRNNYRFAFHTFLLSRFPLPRFPALMFGADNSTPAISTPALWCHDFHSRNSTPANSASPHSFSPSKQELIRRCDSKRQLFTTIWHVLTSKY